MANITPSQLFPNIELVAANGTCAVQSLAIPITDLVGLSVSEADPTSGDGRELVRILLEQVFTKIQSLEAASQPERFSIAKTQSLPGGISINQIRQTYTINVDLQIVPSEINPASES